MLTIGRNGRYVIKVACHSEETGVESSRESCQGRECRFVLLVQARKVCRVSERFNDTFLMR
jgi:hypothetical protein